MEQNRVQSEGKRVFLKNKHLLLGLLIAVIAIYYTFKNVSLTQMVRTIGGMHYFQLIPAILLCFFSYLLRAFRWSYLLGSVKKVNPLRLYSPLIIGFMGNILPARAGELIRAYLLSKKEDITFSSSIATIFVERLFDVIAVLILFTGTILININRFEGKSIDGKGLFVQLAIQFGWLSLIMVMAIISLSIIILYKKRWIIKFIQIITAPFPERIRNKSEEILNSFISGFRVITDINVLFISLFLTILIWGAILASYYPLFIAFEIDHLPYFSLFALVVSIAIFITVFPTPGFIGSFQAGCVFILNDIFNISDSVAAGFGMVAWLINMGLVSCLGLFFVIKENISIRDITKHNEESHGL